MLDFLFSTRENTLKKAIEELTEEDIEGFCYDAVYYRGTEYYDLGAVKDIAYLGDYELAATVKGSRTYEVTFQWHRHDVSSACTCPYEDTCKHIVAVLLHATLEEVHSTTTINSSEDPFSEHLNQLSKKELIALVKRFAPQEFKTIIKNQYIPEDKSASLVARVVKKVESVLENSELYYDPADMEHALEKQIKKLQGLGSKQSEAINDLILMIIDKVNRLTEEGYLYNSYYDQPFDESQINEFFRGFLKQLPLQKRVAYIRGISKALENYDYGFFEGILADTHELFEKEEETDLREIILENIKNKDFYHIEAYFPIVEPALSLEEKSFILTNTHQLSSTLSLQLALFYEGKQDIEQAIETLVNCRNTVDYIQNRQLILTELLRLKSIHGSLELSLVREVLNLLAHGRTLRLAIHYFPANREQFETIMEKKNPGDLLDYYLEDNRLPEALNLVLTTDYISEHRKYIFFKKHKANFPQQAEDYFVNRIEANLQHTGKQYYQRIADTLQALNSIAPQKSIEIKAMIRQNYKRRTNLMALL